MAACRGAGLAIWVALSGIGVLAMVAPPPVHADALEPYEEYGKHLRAAREIAPLSDNVFGDQVSLYNGATTFSVTDMSLPGNSALPVSLGRSFAVNARRIDPGYIGGFGEWNVEVPSISGVFTAQNGWTLYGSTPTSRCTDNRDPPNMAVPGDSGFINVQPDKIWDGNQLHIPGMGDQTLYANTQSKSPAYASRTIYPWVTKDNWKISCISSVTNLTGDPNLSGEGFVALSPSGVKYTFNYVVRNIAPTVKVESGSQTDTTVFADRVRVYLLATHVQDRFGNYVDYHYTGDHLTSITSNDGRSITLTWSGDTIVSVSSALGTWTYGYGTDANGLTTLTSVTRPDGSQWTYHIVSGSTATAPPADKQWGPDNPMPLHHCQLTPYARTGDLVYSVGAPSGASASFHFRYLRHYRTGVPLSCNDGEPDHAYPEVFTFFDNFTLVSKTVTGVGLPSMTWSYDSGGVYADESGSAPGYFSATVPYDPDTQLYLPGGSCGDSSVYSTTVTGPTSVVRYAFGNLYGCNEGKLYGTQVGYNDSSGQFVALKTTNTVYVDESEAPGEPFPSIAGSNLLPNYVHPDSNRLRPSEGSEIAQDGATFTSMVNSFDAFARATSVTGESSLGYSKTTLTEYFDNTSLWVLGQASKSTVNGIVASQTDYDSLARPVHTWSFGKLVSTKGWNADGTLYTITDGNNHTTTLSDWYRGLPRTVSYADGSSESVAVNDAGWITSLTDENGYATGYGYDAMGRVSEIDYPAGDSVAWNKTYISFAPYTAGSEYGIPAGHWKQTIHTGNGYSITYFDALWRPLVTDTYDSGNVAATRSVSVKRYDAGGRTIFGSYPMASVPNSNYASANTGTHTSYDALNRVTEVDQDGELGTLVSKTAYLSGFKTQVTNPRGYATTTSYMAYGAPSTDWPVSIVAPEGETTTITRDAFGKPLTITRAGAYNGVAVSLERSYVYDANQLLCKRIEPETGATLFAYDGANNLAWSAPGTTLTGNTCDRGSVSAAQEITRSYNERNQVLSVNYPDGISNTQYTYYPDGALKSASTANGGSTVLTSYGYDRRRLLTAETLSVPGTAAMSLGYSYDANGHLSAQTYPDGRSVTYVPNALGQPTQAGTYATGVSYYPNGAIKQFTYGDGSVHTMTQNLRQLPERSLDALAGTAVQDDSYDYDPNGNVAAITDGVTGNVGNRDMTYDGLDRLTATTSPMFVGTQQATFKYDPLDNLRSAGVGDGNQYTYYYDSANRLTGLSGTASFTFGYDARGNRTSSNATSYTFDEANRLLSVSGVESYLYDAAGRRARKVTSGGATTYFDYSQSGALMYELDPATLDTGDYIYLGGSLVAKVTEKPVPATPTSISVPATSSTGSVTVAWSASTGVTSYVLQQQFNGGSFGTIYNGTATSHALTGLGDGNYVFRVQACNANGCSGWKTSGTLVVTHPPASAPTLTVPSGTNTTGSYTVSWSSVSTATSYTLQEQTNGGAWTTVYSGSALSDAISGKANGTYGYRVQACNAGGCSAFSATQSVSVVHPVGPSTLSGPSFSSTGTFTLSWAAVSGATRYQLNQSANGGAAVAVYNSTGTAWSSSALGNGAYAYVVYACNSVGCSPASNQVTVTVTHPPGTPSLSVPSGTNSTGSYTVSWSAVSTATSYTLQQQVNGGAWSSAYSGTATSKAFSGKANGSYGYRVQACNAGGCSAFSATGTVSVVHPPASAPSLSGPSSSTSGTFTLSWTAVTGATSYHLHQIVNGSNTLIYASSSRSWSSSALGNGSYAYQVYACNAGGCGPVSNTVTVSVLHIPASPAWVTAPSNATLSTPFTVSWAASNGATSYTLQQTDTDNGNVTTKYTGSARSASVTVGLPGFYQYAVKACNSAGCSGWRNAPNLTDVERAGRTNATPQSEPASGSSL